jgi:hypothetical protein
MLEIKRFILIALFARAVATNGGNVEHATAQKRRRKRVVGVSVKRDKGIDADASSFPPPFNVY